MKTRNDRAILATKYYATKPPGTSGGKKLPPAPTKGGKKVTTKKSATYGLPLKIKVHTPKPKHIFDVTHYEDEKMVGVLMSYKAAAVITWLLGECKAGNDTGDWMRKLNAIDPVDDWHGEICSGWVESRSAYDFKDFLED